MPRVDLLLKAPSKQAPIRVGDLRGSAPFVLMACEGQTAVMPFPVNVTTGNQILWEQKDFTAGSALGASVLQGGQTMIPDTVSDLKERAGKVGESLPSIAIAGLHSGVGGLAGITDADDLYYHQKGKAVNPNKEMTFNGVGYRSFTFSFQLIPLSEAEANAIGTFVKFFQEKAMPDYGDPGNKTYFKYPETWNLSFHNVSVWFPRMLPCYLTDYQIDYGGAGKMSIHSSDGNSVQTNITLTFTEAELHMRDKVNQGFIG